MSTCKRMWTDRAIRSMADESAKIRIEAGQTENAKPIYFHPIRFNISGSSGGQEINVVSGSIMILNNSSEPINTSAKLKSYLATNTLDVLCNVDFYDSQGVYQGQILKITGSENIQCTITKDGANTSTLYLAETEFLVQEDNVNKIN